MSDLDRRLASEVEAASPRRPPPYAEVLVRRDRRRTRRRAGVAVAGAVVLVAGVLGGTAVIGGGEPHSGGPVASPTPTPSSPEPPPDDAARIPDVAPEWAGTGAPPVVLHLDERQVRLQPWTACYTDPPGENGISQGGCYDGLPQPPFEDVGDRTAVPFAFPLAGWRFEATFSRLGESGCERQVTVPVEKTGKHTFLVPPAGPPGDHQVDLFGRGPGGDVITTFRWSTAESGHLPEPSGYVGLLTRTGGDLRLYPLELGLADLAETPRSATATVSVTDADGDREVFGPVRAEPGCAGEGRLHFRGPGGGDAVPTDLGPGPFSYRAEVTLDGTTYVGTAVWPRDERRDMAPYADLVFDPPLPAYEG